MNNDDNFLKVSFDGVIKKAKSIFSKKKSPFFLVIKDRISENVSLIREETAKRFKEFKIAYPVKTNPDPILLSELFFLGSDFMISGINEFYALTKAFDKMGVQREVRIFYYSPVLNPERLDDICSLVEEYNSSDKSNARLSLIFVIDSEEQLRLINLRKNLKFIIRLNVFSKFKEENFVESEESRDLDYGENVFFGINSMNIKSIFNDLKIRKNGFLGFHCHMRSQIQGGKEWDLEISRIVHVFKFVLDKGFKCSIVNLGGGLSVDYSSLSFGRDISYSFKNYEVKKKKLSVSLSALEKGVKEMLLMNSDTDFYFEPGRFISADSFLLVTRVIAKKIINDLHIIVVDSSVYNSSMDSLVVGLRLPVICPENCYDSGKKKTEWIIKGSTPCSLDWFNKVMLCSEPEIGCLLIFDKAGAYNYSSDFASLKKLKSYLF